MSPLSSFTLTEEIRAAVKEIEAAMSAGKHAANFHVERSFTNAGRLIAARSAMSDKETAAVSRALHKMPPERFPEAIRGVVVLLQTQFPRPKRRKLAGYHDNGTRPQSASRNK